MANNLNINFAKEKPQSGDVVKREIFFFQCKICHKSRRQSLKEARAGELICKKCRKSNVAPGQTSLLDRDITWVKKNDGCYNCPKCLTMMNPIYENNGFNEPEGPSHVEITGYECPNCGHKE